MLKSQSDLISTMSREVKNIFNSNIFNFKVKQYNQLEEMVRKRAKMIDIENKIRFIDFEFLDNYNPRTSQVNLEGLSYTFFIKLKYLIEEEEEIELVIELPKLIEDEYFFLKGVRYRYLLSFNNERTAIHNNGNILIRSHQSRFKILLSGVLSFELFTKRIPFQLPMLILNNFDFTKFLNDIFGGENGWILLDEKPTLVDKNKFVQLTKNQFLVIRFEYLSQFQTAVLASLKKVKNISFEDYENSEVCFNKFVSHFSSVKSEKSKLFAFLFKNLTSELDDPYNLILNEINLYYDGSVNNNSTDYRRLTFLENIIDPLFKGIHDRRLTYVNSHFKDRDKILQIFNKGKLKNIIISKLLTSKLLQYDDSTRAISSLNSLKVSLTTASGQAVSSESRDLDESYIGLTDLFSSANGDATGLSTFLCPVSNNEVFVTEEGLVQKFKNIKSSEEEQINTTAIASIYTPQGE